METTLQTTDTGLQIAEVQRIIGEAPATLQSNRKSTQNSIEFADNLIQNSKKVGMNDILDGQMASYVEKGRKTITAINDRRKPFTQMVDLLKKEFTGLESLLKAKVDEVQHIRNEYATKKMEEQQERERQVLLQQAKEREAIELKRQSEIQLADNFSEYLKEAKKVLIDKFNSATLDNLDAIVDIIAGSGVTLTKEVYITLKPSLKSQYHEGKGLEDIILSVIREKFPGDAVTYSGELSALRREIVDKKMSKRAELEALAKADEAERSRIEEERRQREKAERLRLETEAEAARQKATADAAVEAAGATAAAMVDARAAIASVTPDVKEGYEIILKNIAANLLIAQCWFENEGKTLSQEKIDKVTFARMRKFCETYALKTGGIISNSMIEYKPVYQAK